MLAAPVIGSVVLNTSELPAGIAQGIKVVKMGVLLNKAGLL